MIRKYLHEFHDGALLAIESKGEEYVLSLESAEIDPADIQDGFALSERNTIKGKLHLKGVQTITVNELKLQKNLMMQYDYGSIFDFLIQGNMVEIQVSWRNLPPKSYVNDFSTIVIEAQDIWWENIPDLLDLSW